MKKTMNRMIIGAAALLLAVPVFASDGAIVAWRRDTSGTLTSGIDQYGNVVAPTVTVSVLSGAINASNLTAGTSVGAVNLAAGTNLLAGSIVGNIAEANLTNAAASLGDDIGGNISEAALTNAAATLGDDIGGNIPEAALTNAAGTLGDNIGGNIPEAAMTNGLATTIGLAASALQPNTIVVSGATSAVDTAAITVSNGLGAASTVVGIWSAATNGAASTANLISLVATTGTLLSETNSATIVIVTDATGYAALTATVSAATTNYAAFVQNNGVRVSSDEMVFDGP